MLPKMKSTFFPLKKLRRNGRCLLFGTILLIGVAAVYHEMVAANAWSNVTSLSPDAEDRSGRKATSDGWVQRDQPNSKEDSAAWSSSYTPQTWKPEYMGRANLHVFEDWCGGSTAELRRNMHYPLYPHARMTVTRLAISPQWTDYGLRIFGYLHPYTDGEFVFALSSDDNSELWLSTDDSPLNLQLLAWVGKTGTEWTVPGEFDKFASQISRPVRLSAKKRYFFEVIHKQNNKGTDHIEVAWQLLDAGLRFMVIESKHISLYVNESAFLMGDVTHIPQTAASHQHTPTKQQSAAADMLREDPRDAFYQAPLINSKFLQGVLPDCSYKPSYIIKDFPLLRYQGLQFVHLSYIYPNDYTRLTHMESENSCFYPENPDYMKMFGSSRYMTLDHPYMQERGNEGRGFRFQGRQSLMEEEYEFQREARLDQIGNALYLDYGDDYDDYTQKRRRKLFSILGQETKSTLNSSESRLQIQKLQWEKQQKDDVQQPLPQPEKLVEPLKSEPKQISTHHPQQNQAKFKLEGPVKRAEERKTTVKRPTKTQRVKSVKMTVRPRQTNLSLPVGREQLKGKERPIVLSEQRSSKQRKIRTSRKTNQTKVQRLKVSKLQPSENEASLVERPTVVMQRSNVTREVELQPAANKRVTMPRRDINRPLVRLNQRDTNARKDLRDKEIEMNMPLQKDLGNSIHRDRVNSRDKKWLNMKGLEEQARLEDKLHYSTEDRRVSSDIEFDTGVNWNQTFQVNHLDLQARRSDWIDQHCNISGNLLLHASDALPMVKAFMDQLNKKHHGRFTLVRVVNVVKRMDRVQGSRYLLELELRDVNGQLLRLSQYIYALIRRSRDFGHKRPRPDVVLCNPLSFRWNPFATVHFIVPVKNQARWVQQLIADMEKLFKETGDTNFNLIIADYNSTDMDVRKALQKASLPSYQYVKLSGNFERSAGLQEGVNLVNDNHSIVFLCDLHIHFPPSIIDTIRKHCVEGYMAFAPIVMRLGCGATPLEARGFWEVNGFGLLGIYKSDLEAVGGMNTKEFTNRWGGEDWELLDRILQAGLEVERIYLRNFFHHYHSKRGMWNRQVSPNDR